MMAANEVREQYNTDCSGDDVQNMLVMKNLAKDKYHRLGSRSSRSNAGFWAMISPQLSS